MKKLTLKQLANLEQRANDYIAIYGSNLAGRGSGPPSPEETLALVSEIRTHRTKKKKAKSTKKK